MKNKELRKLAQERMQGKMGKALGISVIYFIITFLISYIPLIGGLASLILATPLAFGWTKQIILLANGENVGVMDFFKHGFGNFGKVWCSNLWISLKCLLPIILLAVGGGVAAMVNGIVGALIMLIAFIWLIDVALKYVMINYTIAYDEAGSRARDLVKKSAKEAKGNIWRFLCMGIYYGLQAFAMAFLLSLVSGIITVFLANINVILSLIAVIIIYVSIAVLSVSYSIRNIAACSELYKQNILSKENEGMNI